mmetsp:Transcript_22195/g.27232  ORF Transcript_22195/g.27232 Transcript_22195/m.27232 type:complete len:173 (-) Transcript_22195:364-882(-)
MQSFPRLLIISILLLILCSSINAQFGVPKENPIASEQQINPLGEQTDQGPVTRLTEEDARNISALIQAAGEDPETIQMIAKLKDENADELEELRKSPAEEILNGLKSTLDDLQMLDVLFEDPQRALLEMEKEGLLPPQHLKKYKKNPELLEDDTRRSLYFNFVSLAVVGGYL